MKLRDYQEQAAAAILGRLEIDRSTLCLMPTGCGKTVVFAAIAAHFAGSGRVMVVAHREELLTQAAKKLYAAGGERPEVEKADQWANAGDGLEGLHSAFVVASIQTLTSGEKGRRRMHRFPPEKFSLVIFDEAHHVAADTYRECAEWFSRNPNLKILGLTATGDRGDGEGLGCVFESVAYTYELPDAVRDGWLVPVRQRQVVIDGLDFSKCRTTAGDLNQGDLAAIMEFEATLHPVAHAALEVACGLEVGFLATVKDEDDRQARIRDAMGPQGRCRKSLVFAASVDHAQRLAEIFGRWIDGCARFVCGKTDPETRRKILAGYAAGDFPILVNVGIATEGFDAPGIELVVMARPTKSRALYCQMLGRGTRPLESIARHLGEQAGAAGRRSLIAGSGKPAVEVLDFVGNSGRHKLVTAVDILAGANGDSELIDRARQLVSDGMEDVGEALAQAAADVELDRAVALMMAEKEAERLQREEELALQAEAARRAGIVGTTEYRLRDIDAGDVYDTGDGYDAPKAKGGASDAQIEFLVKLGVRRETAIGYGKGQAAAVITSLKAKRDAGPASPGMIGKLCSLGYDRGEVQAMNWAQAKATIDAALADKGAA